VSAVEADMTYAGTVTMSAKELGRLKVPGRVVERRLTQRRAMVHPGRDRLSGTIEADESYVGGEEAGVSGRQTVKKVIVAIAVELNDGKIGRVRLRCVPDVSASSLVGFPDGWRGYEGLADCGFDHKVTVLSASPDPAHVLMPSVHRAASLLKRWILGTLQSGIAREHLPYYLDEFTFRFNRRSSRARGLLFYRLLEQGVQCGHTPTARLYVGTGRGPRPTEQRERG
jgi:transposase-like protein